MLSARLFLTALTVTASVSASACPAAHAQGAYAVPPTLTLTATVGGRPATTVLAGQRVVFKGTMTPAARGETVTLDLERSGKRVLSRSIPVRLARTGGGRFRYATRFRREGRLIAFAIHAPSAVLPGASAPPVAVKVEQLGTVRGGCGYRPVVAGMSGRTSRVARQRLALGATLGTGSRITVPPGGRLRLREGRATYTAHVGAFAIECDALGVRRGTLGVRTSRSSHGAVLVRNVLARVGSRGRVAVTTGPATFRFRSGRGSVISGASPTSIIRTIKGDEVVLGSSGTPRMNTWPFARSPDQRPARASDHLPAFWADGRACSVGCRPSGARTGWPLRPFHRQHALRAGMNELRAANMHIGIDIQAKFGSPVFAIQAGTLGVGGQGTSDIHVSVGDYEYWHVHPSVATGSHVRAGQVIGHIIFAARHLHLSEVHGGAYVNVLRPGGRVLAPWSDHEPPIIGPPTRAAGGATVEVFDPQSFRITQGYRTPVLAPAAVAWRARTATGLTPLTFAYRGSQHYPTSAKYDVFVRGSHAPDNPAVHSPGWLCFDEEVVCVPRWDFRLPGVPADARQLVVYAWDWAGNRSVLAGRVRSARSAPIALAPFASGTEPADSFPATTTGDLE